MSRRLAAPRGKGPVRFRVVESEEGSALGALVGKRLGKDAKAGRALVRAGAVYVGHLRVRLPTVRVLPGERVTVYPEALEHEPLALSALEFAYRDDEFVVLDKPAGVPVAQTKQSARGTLAEALRRKLEEDGMARPYVGVVHRLDRKASGLVLFTVRSIANRSLHKQFVDHRIDRRYRVRVHGEAPATLTCDAPLRERGRGRMQVAQPGDARGQSARTELVRLQPQADVAGQSLLEATLITGRTHQIRVHASDAGHPVVGDDLYGGDPPEADLRLHAWRLAFDHPRTGEPIVVRSELPAWARADDEETP